VRQRFAALAIALGLVAGGIAVTASPAVAATTDAYCAAGPDDGDACFYYLTNWSGSMVGIENRSISDVESPWIDFITSGTGKGDGIGNAAGSEGNGDFDCSLRIYIHHEYGGTYDTLGPLDAIDHDERITINNERSYKFITC
jgi:hypothetical protein